MLIIAAFLRLDSGSHKVQYVQLLYNAGMSLQFADREFKVLSVRRFRLLVGPAERIDPLRFLAGCRTGDERRLNQALSALSLSLSLSPGYI